MCSSDIFLGLLAILFPPIAVWVKCGICSADSVINILLCMLGFIPGLLHAWYIIARNPDPTYESLPQEIEGGRVTYVVVAPNHQQHHQAVYKHGAGHQGYGTTAPMGAHVHQAQDGTWDNGDFPAATSNQHQEHATVPPTYAEAIKGDNKVQSVE